MKKLKFFLVTMIFVVIISLSVCAEADFSDVVVSLQLNNPIMEVNGEEVEIDPGRGTIPCVKNQRTLVPIRAIIEAFGGTAQWQQSDNSVILTYRDNTIKLYLNSTKAYLNKKAQTLDVSPIAVNGRTMLPIRFIAEGFNIGVGWNGQTQTIVLVRNEFDDDEYTNLMRNVKSYSGLPYITVNNNRPYFKDFEIIDTSFEFYRELDDIGRCNVCFASVAKDIMPTEKRGNISSIKPTGWINKSYSNVDGGYLYNRCHLIGFQLTGENANKRNLITGTRYLNVDGMLPFENDVASYVKSTGNHVVYRVTPVFIKNNLVADGVLMEAYSVEDKGKGISFCVYCYNVQPDIIIDYLTGNSIAVN